MNTSAEQIAEETDNLTTFSDVAFRISDVLEDETSSAADIGQLIQPDPALSAALLRIANSASYKTHATVDNIEAAIKSIGVRQVRDLAYAICATKAFAGIPNELISMEDFWKHSLYCAVAAQKLAEQAQLCRGVSLFTAGLLHDIGQLAMFHQHPQLSRTALQSALDLEDDQSICVSEQSVFGFDHMDVGAALAKRWKFPETLLCSIAHHHEPTRSAEGTPSDVAMIVNVANSLGVLAELESHDFSDAPPIHHAALKRCDLGGQDALFQIVDEASESAHELLQLFVS